MKIIYSKIAPIIIFKNVIITDTVFNKTKFLFCFASYALLIAGMRTLAVGMVVIKILNDKVAIRLLMFKLNKTIIAGELERNHRKMEKFYE